MPIHINLLAEAQAAEELRRRDPVKRAIFFGVTLAVLMLVWSGMIQMNSVLQRERLAGAQIAIAAHNTEYTNVLAQLNKIAEANGRLAALQKLQSARFLQGNLLNALQQVTVEDVQLTRFQEIQTYFVTPGTPSRTNDNRVLAGRPGTSRERVALTIDAADSSANPGDQINKFKQAIADQSYFKAMLGKTNSVELVGVPSLQTDPNGRPIELFRVGFNFPEQTR